MLQKRHSVFDLSKLSCNRYAGTLMLRVPYNKGTRSISRQTEQSLGREEGGQSSIISIPMSSACTL